MYPTKEETALWIALNLTQRSVYQVMDEALQRNGLPPLRWYDVLWAIERAEDKGARAFELKDRLLFEQSNLSRLLRRIVSEGLVEESVCENDRRGKVLRISARGRAVREEMWKTYGPLIHDYMSRLPAEMNLKDLTSAIGGLQTRDGH